MASELLPKQRAEARKLGLQAVAGWGVMALLAFKASGILAALAAGVAVWLTVRWFRYRASWGMRF